VFPRRLFIPFMFLHIVFHSTYLHVFYLLTLLKHLKSIFSAWNSYSRTVYFPLTLSTTIFNHLLCITSKSVIFLSSFFLETSYVLTFLLIEDLTFKYVFPSFRSLLVQLRFVLPFLLVSFPRFTFSNPYLPSMKGISLYLLQL